MVIKMDYGPVFLAVVAIIVVAAIAFSRKGGPSQKSGQRRAGKISSASLGRQDFNQQWQRIEGLLAQPGVDSTRSAIFEADKLLDIALRQSGFAGETLGERLKNARDHFGNNVVYQGLWEAHKMRNAMAHEIGFDLPQVIAAQHMAKFKAGLQYLKVL
jgi:hypothetical protein